jgi:hypothetical protein
MQCSYQFPEPCVQLEGHEADPYRVSSMRSRW